MCGRSCRFSNGELVRLESSFSSFYWCCAMWTTHRVKKKVLWDISFILYSFSSINGMFEMYGFQSVFSENFELSDQCSVDPIKGG